jgi:hypothetical protein
MPDHYPHATSTPALTAWDHLALTDHGYQLEHHGLDRHEWTRIRTVAYVPFMEQQGPWLDSHLNAMGALQDVNVSSEHASAGPTNHICDESFLHHFEYDNTWAGEIKSSLVNC